jgi:hypothetical protein
VNFTKGVRLGGLRFREDVARVMQSVAFDYSPGSGPNASRIRASKGAARSVGNL